MARRRVDDTVPGGVRWRHHSRRLSRCASGAVVIPRNVTTRGEWARLTHRPYCPRASSTCWLRVCDVTGCPYRLRSPSALDPPGPGAPASAPGACGPGAPGPRPLVRPRRWGRLRALQGGVPYHRARFVERHGRDQLAGGVELGDPLGRVEIRIGIGVAIGAIDALRDAHGVLGDAGAGSCRLAQGRAAPADETALAPRPVGARTHRSAGAPSPAAAPCRRSRGSASAPRRRGAGGAPSAARGRARARGPRAPPAYRRRPAWINGTPRSRCRA